MTGPFLAHALPAAGGFIELLAHAAGGGHHLLALIGAGVVGRVVDPRRQAFLATVLCTAAAIGAAFGAATERPLPAAISLLAAAAIGSVLVAGGRVPDSILAVTAALLGGSVGASQGAVDGWLAADLIVLLVAASGLVVVGGLFGLIAEEGAPSRALHVTFGVATIVAGIVTLLGDTALRWLAAVTDPDAATRAAGQLVNADLSVGASVGALGLAALVGAVHALAPGHGKIIVGAYLVGDHGRPRHAVALGLVVALMHSAAVLAVGLVLHGASRFVGYSPAAVGWQTLAAGLLVAGVGLKMLRRELARRRQSASTAEGAGHGHAHAGPGRSPLSRRGLVALGAGGGLLPSPTGLAIVTGAAMTGRALFGVALVAAFSIGLAATLMTGGLMLLYGTDRLRRTADSPRFARTIAAVPMAAACAVVVSGIYLVSRAAVSLSVAPPHALP